MYNFVSIFNEGTNVDLSFVGPKTKFFFYPIFFIISSSFFFSCYLLVVVNIELRKTQQKFLICIMCHGWNVVAPTKKRTTKNIEKENITCWAPSKLMKRIHSLELFDEDNHCLLAYAINAFLFYFPSLI